MLTGLVGGFIIYTVILDFTDPVVPDWNLFREEELPSATETHSIKAAMLAMAGAATLFISLIPVSNSNRGTTIDLLVRVMGAIAVVLTGWFWLLSATNGNPGPYLVAIVPSMAIFVLAFIVMIILRLAGDLDERQLKETGTAKPTKETFIMGLVMTLVLVLAFALIFGALVFLPKWLF